MNEGNVRAKELILKYLRNELSVEQTEELNTWIASSEANKLLFTDITEGTKLRDGVAEYAFTQGYLAEKNRASVVTMAPKRPVSRAIKWMIAASILGLISTGAYFSLRPSDKTASIVSNKPANTILESTAPSPKAILTMGDSSVIVLSDIKNGDIANNAGVEIKKTAEGELLYGGSTSYHSNKGTEAWHTITTPKGGYYKVTLPDGSVAVLNAESSLHFPPHFSQGVRMVELTGEAYFEISKDPRKRFIVEANGFKTEVLGTHFNINAYGDEPLKKITLVEGSIKVSSDGDSMVLAPGIQGAITPNGGIANKRVDTEGIIAWTKGQFYFDDVYLPEAIRQIARWYDIADVKYAEGVLPSTAQFHGRMQRNLTLATIIPQLEQIGEVKMELKNNILYIRKK